MNATLSDALLKTVLMAAAFCCAALLLRDGIAIGLHVPLDPNEGWNAYHALAAMSGQALYPHDLMVNNYPPLSFYVVGAAGQNRWAISSSPAGWCRWCPSWRSPWGWRCWCARWAARCWTAFSPACCSPPRC